METVEKCQTPEKIKVGPDQVTITGNQLMIDARHIMPDWQVREFAPIPIYFRNTKYFLRQKTAGAKPYAMRYLLEVWPAENREIPRSTLDYNEEVVSQREADLRGAHYENAIKAFLLLFFPLLGMLWSGTKEKLARFGIISRTVTGLSIMLTFGLVLLDGIFAKMLLMGSMRSGHLAVGGIIRSFAGKDYLSLGPVELRVLWLDCILFVLLVLDVLIRYTQHLRDDEFNMGFLEWLSPRKRPVPQAV
jgi:hypothetical protein